MYTMRLGCGWLTNSNPIYALHTWYFIRHTCHAGILEEECSVKLGLEYTKATTQLPIAF